MLSPSQPLQSRQSGASHRARPQSRCIVEAVGGDRDSEEIHGKGDPVLFKFLQGIVLPSNDRYPMPSTTHVPVSDEGATCWSRRCLAEEAFGQPSVSLAVCFGALAGDIGYTYQSLVAATREEVVSRCKGRLTPAQLVTLMAHLPLCNREGHNSLVLDRALGASLGIAERHRRGNVVDRRPATASNAVAARSHHDTRPHPPSARRNVLLAPEPSHTLLEEDGTPSAAAAAVAKANADSAKQAHRRAAGFGFGSAFSSSAQGQAFLWSPHTDAAGFLIPQPPNTQYTAPLAGGGGSGARRDDGKEEQSASPKTNPAPLSPSPAAARREEQQQQWPLYLAASTEDVRRRLEASSAAAHAQSGDRLGHAIDGLHKALDPFMSDAARAFTFRSLRLRELLVDLGVAVKRSRPAVAPPKKRKDPYGAAANGRVPLSRRGFRNAVATIQCPSPPPEMVEELVVTYASLTRLMDCGRFTAAERRHAQAVWTWELVDKATAPRPKKRQSKGLGSASVGLSQRSPSPPRPPSAAGVGKRRKMPFARYGSPKYLAWLQKSSMLYEDFGAWLDAHQKRFLRTAFGSLAADGGWYWLKFNLPKALVALEGAPTVLPLKGAAGDVGDDVDSPFSPSAAVPIAIPTRISVALALFEEKSVEVLTFEDFCDTMHDDTCALVAFMGHAFGVIPSKERAVLAPVAGGGGASASSAATDGRAQPASLFGIHRTGKGASGAN